MSTALKTWPKTFTGKVSGQRLPPIPIANEPSPSTISDDLLQASILENSTLVTDDDDRTIRYDDDNLETPRVMFQKSPHDVMLLLDTYPPKTYVTPKCLKANYGNQGQADNSIFDTVLTSGDHQRQHDFNDPFPPPLSDRLPSSRYCRRSVSSACSRRSSILFPRQPSIPVDSTQLCRQDSFDTVRESLTDNRRSSYTPLPPIPTDSPSKSLHIPADDPRPGVSPPLITTKELPDIQQKKDEYARRLLSKSLLRQPSAAPAETTMASASITHKAPVSKPVTVTPRLPKPMVEIRQVASIERHVPAAPIKPKMATASSTSAISTSHQRLGKFSLDLFQPQSKSTTATPVTTKKTPIVNNKNKVSIKTNVPKVKVTPTIANEENIQTTNDVIPSPSASPSPPSLAVSNETSQVPTIVAIETVPSPVVNAEFAAAQMEQTNLKVVARHKRHSSSSSAHRPSHPVPKPLTLQGEKPMDIDCPQMTTRPVASATGGCQRRGSLKSQPVITELFEDSSVEIQMSPVKTELTPSTNPSTVRMKKQRPVAVLKSAKAKKPPVTTKAKPVPAVITKAEMKCQSTNTETAEDPKPDVAPIVIGGPNWMMTANPKVLEDDDPMLSYTFDAPTVDDEDLPSCYSPSDEMALSQTTLMTSFGDVGRRNSIESVQAIEVSPVLTQNIQPPIEPAAQPSKPNLSSLVNSAIRTVYETVEDSIRKDSSFRSMRTKPSEQEIIAIKSSLPTSTASLSSQDKTLPFQAAVSVTHTYNNSDMSLSMRPALRVVNDSLNSRGSETIHSTSSHEDYSSTPLCTESDCDEIYRTARKGKPVGKGAYGIVWSYLTITGRVIAVKEIELDEGDSERVRDDYDSVREEIHILRALNHPYIVKFLGISLENTRLVKIFMEYLPNGTIENLITSFGPFHNDVLRKYTRQIVEGVAYLHANSVVHRDIKGKNVMLDVDGNIKLIDFGCAKRLKKNQNTHSMRQILKSMKGTANWMAPEVIAETGHGKKADIWSIGCTLCEMATGKPPWSSEHNQVAVLLIIVNGTKPPADLPDTCPAAGQEFFRLCLTRDPVTRPSATELLTHPFLAS